MKNYFQRLSSAMMLPVSILPVASILIGIGYWVDPGAMSGEGTNALAIGMIQAGNVITGALPILFAVGIAGGMSKDDSASSGLSGLVAYLMITTLLNPDTISVITGTPVESIDSAFGNIENVFIGIISGMVAAALYNRFWETRLPSALAFFNGKRLVPILTAGAAILIALLLFFIWPVAYGGLVDFGTWMAGLGAVGAGLYGFFNRLLIPTGLHHALNSVFWFDTVGINDIGNFWAGTGELGITGMYQAGFFPIMMFGLPAAAFAMYKNARPENKEIVGSQMLTGGVSSFFTGITEALEFSFMFASPLLYFVHALLTGISMFVAASLQTTAGFTFSAGLVDYVLSFNLPLANNPWILLIIGVIIGVIYYVVFDFLFRKFDLQTPGRGHIIDEDIKASSSGSGQGDSDDKYYIMASEIYQAVGKSDNIEQVNSCATRVRLVLKDTGKVDDGRIKRLGVPGAMKVDGRNYHVIVGTDVQFVADKLRSINSGNLKPATSSNAENIAGDSSTTSTGGKFVSIYAPANGKLMNITEVSDPVFAQKTMGDGFAIQPTDDKIVAPIAGEVIATMDAKHAIGLRTEDGLELLVHMGMDTVELNGEGFENFVAQGDKVSVGEPIASMDRAFVEEKSKSTEVVVVITNSKDILNQKVIIDDENVAAGDKVGDLELM